MQKIDFHVHSYQAGMLPMAYYRHRADELIARRRGSRTRDELAERIRANSIDPGADLLVKDLDTAGLDHAVLVDTDWGMLAAEDEHEPGAGPHAHLAYYADVVRRHPGWFSIVPGIDPRRPEAGEFARKALRNEWVAGVKLYPPMGFSAADTICDPVYREVAEAGKFVMFHTGRQTYPFDIGKGRLEQYAQVQRRFPEMSLVLAHSGYPFWGRHAIEVALGHPRTYLDLSGWHHKMDDGGAESFLRACFTDLGPRRTVFASDHLASPLTSKPTAHIRPWREMFERVATECGVSGTDFDAGARELLGRDG